MGGAIHTHPENDQVTKYSFGLTRGSTMSRNPAKETNSAESKHMGESPGQTKILRGDIGQGRQSVSGIWQSQLRDKYNPLPAVSEDTKELVVKYFTTIHHCSR